MVQHTVDWFIENLQNFLYITDCYSTFFINTTVTATIIIIIIIIITAATTTTTTTGSSLWLWSYES